MPPLEATHIPLIVMDPSGRFTGDTNIIRTGLCSSVNLLNMFVTSPPRLHQEPATVHLAARRRRIAPVPRLRWAILKESATPHTLEERPSFRASLFLSVQHLTPYNTRAFSTPAKFRHALLLAQIFLIAYFAKVGVSNFLICPETGHVRASTYFGG